MKNRLLYIILLIVVLAACKRQPQYVDPAEHEAIESILSRVMAADSIASADSVPAAEPVREVHRSQSVYPSGVPSSSESDNDDGMRGFDPATEDDMDDNGMTRYMENTDERGWM